MSASITGGLLVEQPIERFRSFGAFGSPAWQGHVQIRSLVRQRLGERHANVFAIPHYDPETALIRWTAPVSGEVRPWNDLSTDDQVRHLQTLEELRRDLVGLVDKLRSQAEGRAGGSSGFASLLEQALKVPAGDRFLYLVGEQPMIAFWGFENAKEGSVDGLVSAVSALPTVSPLAPLPSGFPPVGVRPPLAAAPMAGAAQASTAVVTPRPRRWWQWLLLGLGLLLLLIPLLFLLRSCLPVGAPGLSTGVPGMSSPGSGLSGGGGEGAPRQPAAPSAVQPSAMDPAVPPGASGGAMPAVPPASGAGGPEGPGVVDPAQPAMPNKPTSLPPPVPAPSLSPPSGQPPGQKPPPVPQDPKSLQVPPEPRAAASLDFLLGDWKAGEGLFDKNTKAPLDVSMKFGPGGRGEMTVRRPDGTACTGAVQGRMDGGRLTVEGDRSVPCVDGGSYGAPKIECSRTSTGETQCQGVNRDGSRYFVDMRRR
jgi:hypothetical protein